MSADKLDINVFHDEVTGELKKIEALDDIAMKKQQTLELKARIEKVSHLLPTYQQLSYSDKIKSLLDSEPAAPRRRFKFSEKAMEARKNRQTAPKEPPRVFQEDTIEPSVTSKSSTVLHISDKSPLVTEIKDSIIITSQCSTATFKHITNCILIIDSQGPVFINNSNNCIFFIHCHQLRIHDSSALKIQALIPSGRGVIEHCEKMVFDGIDIDDFDHPNGGSKNFVLKSFSEELMDLNQRIRADPNDVLEQLNGILDLHLSTL